jgi:hypothetical protein
LNICPPFLAAGARAAQTRSLPAAARITLLILAGSYAYLGMIALGWRFSHA